MTSVVAPIVTFQPGKLHDSVTTIAIHANS